MPSACGGPDVNLTTQITTITLAGGERVDVFDFHVRATYALLLAGKPNAGINEKILERSVKDPQEWWHDQHAALVLRPSEEEIENRLPDFRMMALLDCSTPLIPEYDGSMLRVVWFSDALPNNLSDFLQQSLAPVEWKARARDYYL